MTKSINKSTNDNKRLKSILKKKDRQSPRTNGKSKPIQTKSHKEAYTYTHKKRKRKNIYIYKRKRATKPINKSTNVTSTKNYTKKKGTDRTLGQMVKAKLYRQNHTKKHTHTHSQNEKKEKIYIY